MYGGSRPCRGSTGKGIMVNIIQNDKIFKGTVYFGISNTGIIYHLYFECVDDTTKEKTALDIINKSYPLKKKDDAKFTSKSEKIDDEYVIDFKNNGVATIKYPNEDYSIEIYPIRKDLLPKL